MTRSVVDASVAIKWVVAESGSSEAVTLLRRGRLIAPELLFTECANILWKKAQRGELSAEEAVLAAKILQRADIELLPARDLMEQATTLAITLGHPAYDCLYLAMARANDCLFVTADESLVRKLRQSRAPQLRSVALLLAEVGDAL